MDQIKTFLKSLRQPLLVTVVLMLICGLGFPLVLQGLSMVLFPRQAAGSLVTVDGVAVGAEHVGQEFTEPYFMKGRPSAVHYNTYQVLDDGTRVFSDGSEFGGVASGSSNYGPSKPALQERVEADMEAILAANPGVTRDQIPTDLATASGSGLDPHISPEAAALQLPGISQASGLSMETLEQIVRDCTQGKLLGIFGQETVNVLLVNTAIAQAMGLR